MSEDSLEQSELDPKYEQLAVLVASGATLRAAAEACGVGESNAYRESRTEAFKARVSSIRTAATNEALGVLVTSLKTVIEQVLKLATTGSEKTQLDACKILLSNHAGLASVAELRERVEKLEAKGKDK